MLGNGWTSASPVEVLVQRACDPSLHEPPYAVHVELAEHINNKKANTAREAAMATVRMINHRNPHVSILALALLDSLVQACGYPFHLQISTKEFLNEMVRRFPERPPPFPGPVMARILETIHAWKVGICVESRWKEDLGNIRDMHKLLTFKGYRFRDAPAQQAAVQASTSSLKSPDELEADDRDAQAAKLQELIRRGGPKDLMAAQELMKIMAGANPEAKPDYKSQTLNEVGKLQGKVILMTEMLDNVDTTRGEKFANGDAYHQVSLVLAQARPKIQKWINSAETEDPESLETYLQVNDQINSVLARYEAFKSGDYSIGAVPPELAGRSNAGGSNLIDLLGDDDSTATSAPGGAANELADIFGPGPASNAQRSTPSNPSSHDPRASILAAFSSPPPGSAAAISLPRTPQPPAGHPAYTGQPSQSQGYTNAPLAGYATQQQQASGYNPQMASAQAAIWGAPAVPAVPRTDYAGAGVQWGQTSSAQPVRQAGASVWGGSTTTSPAPAQSQTQSWGGMPSSAQSTQQQPQQPQQQQQQGQQGQKKDPFADLAGLF